MSQSHRDLASLCERTVTTIDAPALKREVIARALRHRRRARQAWIAASLTAFLSALTLAVITLRTRPTGGGLPTQAIVAQVPAIPSFGGIVTADGSRVTFLATGTDLSESTAREMTLVRGAARFDIVHDSARPFRIVAGSLLIEDVGTVFTVNLLDADHVDVHVESGSVRVRQGGVGKILSAGDSETFGPLPGAPTVPTVAVSSTPPAPAPTSPTWQKLARDGDYEAAYAIEGSGRPPDDAEDLLLAADAARYSGHVDGAVPLLRELISRFPSDARVGLAAFTLGRVLLDELSRPREAADAFETATERGGPLAEDALAREAEAWSAAGEREKARALAERYLATYPTGRRAAALRRLTTP